MPLDDEEIYQGSALSKVFGVISFGSLFVGVFGLLMGIWIIVALSVVLCLLFGYAGYRLAISTAE